MTWFKTNAYDCSRNYAIHSLLDERVDDQLCILDFRNIEIFQSAVQLFLSVNMNGCMFLPVILNLFRHVLHEFVKKSKCMHALKAHCGITMLLCMYGVRVKILTVCHISDFKRFFQSHNNPKVQL